MASFVMLKWGMLGRLTKCDNGGMKPELHAVLDGVARPLTNLLTLSE